jgi:hypothetical protein
VLLQALLIALALADPGDRVGAEAHYRRGIEAAQAGDAKRAIEEFEAACARFPSPKVLFNLALAYEAAKQDEAALATFEKFVAKVTQSSNQDGLELPLQTARQRMEALRAQLAGKTNGATPFPISAAATVGFGSPPPSPPLVPVPEAVANSTSQRERPSGSTKWWVIGAGGLLVAAIATFVVVSRNRCPGSAEIGCI